MNASSLTSDLPRTPCSSDTASVAAWQDGGAQQDSTSTSNHSDVRNGFLSIVDQGIVSGTSFVTAVILGRSFTPEQFGIFYLALTLTYVARAIQEQIITTPYMVICQQRRGDQLALYAGSSLVHQTIYAALCVAGILIFALHSVFSAPSELTPTSWILLATVPAILLREHIRTVALSHLQLRTAVLFDLSVVPLQCGGLLLLLYFNALSVTTAFATMGGSCAISCLGWFILKNYPMRFVRQDIKEDFRHNWSLGKWALMSHFVGRCTLYVLPWILLATHGVAAAGILAACTTVIGLPKTFANGLSNFVFPRSAHAFSNGGQVALRHFLWKTGIVYVTALGAFCLLILAFGQPLMDFLYDGKYTETGAILTVLAISVLATSVGNTVANGLWAIQWPQANLAADICATTVTFVAAYFLVQPYSVLGVAIATLVGVIAGAAVRFVTLLQKLAEIQHPAQTT